MSVKVAETPAATVPAAPISKRGESPWRLAVLFALGAIASGILLAGVSAWFLGAVALAGLGPAAWRFNFHTPAAFVRLFALSKTATKYGERVVGHRAALLDQVKRRVGLFAAMARAGSVRAASWQLGNQDQLADYIDDVEDVDYARLRVGMPLLAVLSALAVLVVATAWLAPLALLPIGILALTVLLTLRSALPQVSRHWASVRSAHRAAGRFLDAALAAVVPLKAERAFATLLRSACAEFATAEADTLAQRRAFALLDLLASLAGPLAALGVLLAAWHTGSRGAALLVPAFLAFSWLALGESAQSASRILLGEVRARAARASLADWGTANEPPLAPTAALRLLQKLSIDHLPRRAPDGRRLGDAVSLRLRAGRPTALVGPSGAGKTTLLKQIAGWIGTDTEGRFSGDGILLLTAGRRTLAHVCLHDAAILTDSVRSNLFALEATDTACWEALTAVELGERIKAAGGLDAWISQDKLSLGEAQRLNLARALLSDSPLLLLDEPTEHLDDEQGVRILKRVLERLADRIVVYASHNESAAADVVKITV